MAVIMDGAAELAVTGLTEVEGSPAVQLLAVSMMAYLQAQERRVRLGQPELSARLLHRCGWPWPSCFPVPEAPYAQLELMKWGAFPGTCCGATPRDAWGSKTCTQGRLQGQDHTAVCQASPNAHTGKASRGSQAALWFGQLSVGPEHPELGQGLQPCTQALCPHSELAQA